MTIEQLSIFKLQYQEDEKRYIEYLSKPEFNKETVIANLSNNAIFLATYNMYVKHDFELAKNFFFKSASSLIYLHLFFDNYNYTSRNIFSTQRGFCYSILSDSSKLINIFLGFKDNFFKTLGASFYKAIQAVIIDDYLELEKQIISIEKYTSGKGWEKYFSGSVNAFKGILQKDKTLIENGITELLSAHKKQGNPAVIKDFFSIEGTTLAKLAWRKNIKVDINNKLVPKEMLPIKEINFYETYEFLKNSPIFN